MTAATFDMVDSGDDYRHAIEQGATYRRVFQYKDSEDVPVDITDYIARMQVRQSVSSPTVLLEASTINGRLTINGPTGETTLTLSAETTAAITWTRGKYDLELESPDGTVTRLLEGAVQVKREITRG